MLRLCVDNINWITSCRESEDFIQIKVLLKHLPAGNYMFKVNNKNTRTRCEICSKLTIKTPERRKWRLSTVFIVNFEHISHLAVVLLSLTLTR